MADKKIVIAFELKQDGSGMGQLVMDANALKDVMRATATEADKLGQKFVNFAAFASSLDQISGVLGSLQKGLADLAGAYAMQVEAETKLAVNMRNTMGAREEDIQSIKDLCSAQQELGVIGDEVQLAGAQELATYLEKKESLEQLIPVMNDMLAQQYGLNATQESAAQIATMLGKVMEGQTGALSRYGYKFDEAQEQILKFGTESQRAAVLAEVVESAVGGMNAELAKTDIGRQKQLENTLGDMKEQVGQLAQSILPVITNLAKAGEVMGGLIKLVEGVKTMKAAFTALVPVIANVTQSIKSVTLATKIFGVTLKSVLITSGIGIAIMGIGAAVGYLSGAFDDASDSADKLSAAEERAKEKAEALKRAKEEEENAVKEARAAYELSITRLKSFNGTKEEEKKVVEEMNRTYGDTMGYYSSVSDWYAALTTNSKTYCRQLVIEAKMRRLANEAAENEMAIEELERQRKKLGPAPGAVDYPQPVNEIPAPAPLTLDLKINQFKFDSQFTPFKGFDSAAVVEDMNAKTREMTDRTIVSLTQHGEDIQQQMAENAKELANLQYVKGKPAPTHSGGTSHSSTGSPDPVWTEEAKNIAQVQENIRYLEKERATATGKDLEQCNRKIAKHQELLKSLQELGIQAEKTNDAINESPQTIKDYTDNITILNKQIETATAENLPDLNRQLKEQQDKLTELRNLGIEQPKEETPKDDNTIKALNLKATKLKEIQDNLTYLNQQLQEADATEAAAINKQIALWQKKADAIENAGKASVNAVESIKSTWGNVKGISSGIDGISNALEENGTIWKKLQGIVDGFFQIFDGVSAIITLINTITSATTAAKSADTVATAVNTAATEANTEATIENMGAKAGEAMANATASGAKLPFPANIAAIAAGVAAVVSVLAAVGCFAGGGIVGGSSPSGDKLIARVNSGEMILNRTQQSRLFAMLNNPAYRVRTIDIAPPQQIINVAPSALALNEIADQGRQTVKFRIDGRTLVGVLEKEMNLNLRR